MSKKTISLLLFIIFFNVGKGQSTILFKKPYASFDQKTHREAEKQWKEGNLAEAERLYKKAFENSNHIGHLTALADKKLGIDDIKGYNSISEQVIQYNKERLLKDNALINRIALSGVYYSIIDNNLKKGDPKLAVQLTLKMMDHFGDKITENERSYFMNTYYKVCEIAFLIEDREALEKLYDAAKKTTNGEYGELSSFVYLNILNKQYDTVLNRLLDVAENGAGFTNSKLVAKTYLPIVYAYKGENEKALEWIEKSKKSILIGDGLFQDIYGIIALNKKDYKEAIEKFSIALKGRIVFYVRVEPISKYKLYYLRGLAYQGQGDLLKAKKDFESALVYNSNYQPAINSIATLEGRIVSNRTVDKTAPEIKILEPAAISRDLKITSTLSDIMIKGSASDASGIQSVLINGEKVFSNEKGDFWGNINLKTGLNTLNIDVTDQAGNTSKMTIEVDYKLNSDEISKNIIPVNTKEGRNFALFIASQNYSDEAIPSLENPIADAVKLKLALKNNYNFSDENLFVLYNPDRSEFKKRFIQISETLEPEDNLIIFYAGHGIWVEKEKKGYWLLTDAKRNDVNTWLPNKEVLEMIATVPSRHTLLITDACFSGSVFKTRGLNGDAPSALRDMSEKISRVAITSGNDSEVPDESVFMKHLIRALSETKEKYFTAQKMFITQILEAVMSETKTEPRYGTLELAGHVGGDFIFVKK